MLWALLVALVVFVLLNLFLPAGWAAVIAVLVFIVMAFGGNGLTPRS